MLTLLKTPTTIAIFILVTLLVGVIAVSKIQSNQLKQLERDYTVSSATNLRLNETIVTMQEELSKRPEQLVETTKDVYKELCYGENIEGQIMSLPPLHIRELADPTKEASPNVQKDQYVDRDGLLDPELRSLLK